MSVAVHYPPGPARSTSARPSAAKATPTGIFTDPAERQKLKNKKRTYLAASTRTDRPLDARVKSAERASEIHRLLYGQVLRVSREDVEQGRFFAPDLGENSPERRLNEERDEELQKRDAELSVQLAASRAQGQNQSPNPQEESSGENYAAPQVFPYFSVVPGQPRQTPIAQAYNQGQQQSTMPQTTFGYTFGDEIGNTAAPVANQMQQTPFTPQISGNYPMMGAPGYPTAQFPTQTQQQLPVPQTTVEYTMGEACEYTAAQVPTYMQRDASAPLMPEYTTPDAPGLSAAQIPSLVQQEPPALQMAAGNTTGDTPAVTAAQAPNQAEQELFSLSLDIPDGLPMRNLTLEELVTQIQSQIQEYPADHMARLTLPESLIAEVQNAILDLPDPQVAQAPVADAQGTASMEALQATPDVPEPPAPESQDLQEVSSFTDEAFAAVLQEATAALPDPAETGLRSTNDPTLPAFEENSAEHLGPAGGSSAGPQYQDLTAWSDEHFLSNWAV